MMKQYWKKNGKSWLKAAIIAAGLTAIIKNFLFLPVAIDGSSMIPTFQPKDQILVETIHQVDRFDVIVFRDPSNKPIVKRIIGLPGEHVRYQDDQLYIDGQPLEEPFLKNEYVENAGGIWTSDFALEDLTGEKEVPDGHYFVLGDNRRLSYDSRYYGTIPAEAVVGEALLVYYPIERMAVVN